MVANTGNTEQQIGQKNRVCCVLLLCEPTQGELLPRGHSGLESSKRQMGLVTAEGMSGRGKVPWRAHHAARSSVTWNIWPVT